MEDHSASIRLWVWTNSEALLRDELHSNSFNQLWRPHGFSLSKCLGETGGTIWTGCLIVQWFMFLSTAESRRRGRTRHGLTGRTSPLLMVCLSTVWEQLHQELPGTHFCFYKPPPAFHYKSTISFLLSTKLRWTRRCPKRVWVPAGTCTWSPWEPVHQRLQWTLLDWTYQYLPLLCIFKIKKRRWENKQKQDQRLHSRDKWIWMSSTMFVLPAVFNRHMINT